MQTSMLEQLLSLIAEGGVSTCDDLARRLSIDRPLVAAALEDLVRLGYLQAVEATCAGQCAGCSMGGCSVSGAGQVWTLTGRGARAVQGRMAGKV